MLAISQSAAKTVPNEVLVPGVILRQTLEYLLADGDAQRRRIAALYLNNYFTVVRLDDGNIGTCMSSFHLPASDLAAMEQSLRSWLPSDPLLLGYIEAEADAGGVAGSIRAAVANALSARALGRGSDEFFTSSPVRPNHYFAGINSAVVIGWGGLFDFLVRRTTALQIHVSELLYQSKKSQIDAKMGVYRAQYSYLDLSISDGSDVEDRLSRADLVAITGSTLGNNTLEPLLNMSRNCPRVILQGQSAAIHPRCLFEAGVHLVATSMKPAAVAEAAASDPSGNALRPFFEGGLPRIYLEPRTPEE
jgi:hypothetical protein